MKKYLKSKGDIFSGDDFINLSRFKKRNFYLIQQFCWEAIYLNCSINSVLKYLATCKVL